VKTYTKILVLSCLTSVLSLVSFSISAIDSGKVVFKVGDPIVTNNQGSRDIIKGDDLESGDTILTQSGIVQIQFPDKSFMSLKPKTEFVIDSYNYDPDDAASQQSKYKLNFGEIRTVSGLIGKTNKKDYSIETPVATIGIRGTKFRIVVLKIPSDDDTPSFQMTMSMGEDGAVDIFLPNGETVSLEAGQVSSFGGVDKLIDIIQTNSTVQEALLTTLADLPIAIEQLNNEEGVSQIILDAESQQIDSIVDESMGSGGMSEFEGMGGSEPQPPNAM
jgi:hypothetical protein